MPRKVYHGYNVLVNKKNILYNRLITQYLKSESYLMLNAWSTPNKYFFKGGGWIMLCVYGGGCQRLFHVSVYMKEEKVSGTLWPALAHVQRMQTPIAYWGHKSLEKYTRFQMELHQHFILWIVISLYSETWFQSFNKLIDHD